MGTAEAVLGCLERHKGSFISGQEIADELSVSRNSVWHAIKDLQGKGYAIEAVTKRGYCLSSNCNILSAACIKRHLKADVTLLEYHDTIDSTNNRARQLATQGARHATLVIAGCQTAGRGRQGRPFHSPANSGIYFSLVLRPAWELEDVSLVTSFSAVCVAECLEEILGVKAQIKWVNDIFANRHKVCGILTEASVLPESGSIDYVVVGIGINVAEPAGGWPPELKDVAYAPLAAGQADVEDRRARLAAHIASRLINECETIPHRPHLDAYRSRSLLDGKTVTVYHGREAYEALVVGINDDLTLRVRLGSGEERDLVCGEVHIPSSQLKL